MKYIFILAIATILSACASNSVQTVNLKNTSKEELVTLISSCDRNCQTYISSKYPFKRSSSIMGKDKAVSYVILSELDGARGPNKYFDNAGSFNNSWDGNFKIQTSPGLKTMLIYPTSVSMAPSAGIKIQFEAKKGNTYLVAHLHRRVTTGGTQINHWAPLIMNVVTKEIITPIGEPNWRKYCFAAQEFSYAESCPEE